MNRKTQNLIRIPPLSPRENHCPKQLRCFVVGCNNEHSSHYLLLTSEPLKTQRITFVFEGNAPPICLNVSMFARIICDPALPTEEGSIKFYMNL